MKQSPRTFLRKIGRRRTHREVVCSVVGSCIGGDQPGFVARPKDARCGWPKEGTSTASMYGWTVSGARREAVMRGLFLGVEERGVCFWGGNGDCVCENSL